ncbi:unnamed protein product [Parascedosporium putredinis]|uniref:L-2-hydroxyglutarate dehydrogenase, mitochondrial n=1 Tax=Parascedosporium putredinis TaxID=1442378 RepID=A0A9P1H6F3_9PEZI|nr:unnamed protein product [Parascedosporium putredinis]CAI7998775.1 unnamed protein product [Parascedosporium putredinis]
MRLPLLTARLPLLARSAKQPRRAISTTSAHHADFAHIVIGAGVVGLASARSLAALGPTLLLERRAMHGTETSSRNSEVIHAGLYYGRDSLKTALCIRGRHLLYDFCAEHGVEHRKTGKWIVAQDETQLRALEGVARLAGQLDVPVRWVGEAEVARDGEGVRAAAGCLESPETGIVDSHGFMTALLGLFEEDGGS